MLYPSLSELLTHVNSRYLLVNIIARRAREISSEFDISGDMLERKPVSCAIDELAMNELRITFSDEI